MSPDRATSGGPRRLSARAAAALADPVQAVARAAALENRHVAPLEAYRSMLGARPFPPPHFDPLDGGTDAGLLLLLETPGASSAPIRFVSRDNPTGTAANLRRAFAAAGLTRRETLIWNAVPWVLQTSGEPNRAPRRAEIQAGLEVLPDLLARLPRLQAVVLAGRVAGQAETLLRDLRPDLHIARTAHPSPIYVNTRPDIFGGIVATLAAAAHTIRSEVRKSPAP